MKYSLFLSILLALTATTSSAQDSDSIQFPQLIAGGGHNFQVIGEHSSAYKDSLFAHFNKKEKRGYVWKFKNVKVDGISEVVTLEVHQGLKGYTKDPRYNANKCGGSAYFYTFTSEKRKAEMLENQSELEFPGLVIYIKQGNKYSLKNPEEVKLMEAYLRAIYEG